MKVLGLDLSSKPSRPSGYALLNLDFKVIDYGHMYGDDEIKNYIMDTSPNILSIDAPLSISNSGFRDCEKLMLRYGFKVYPTTIKWMRMLALRGINITRYALKHGIKVIETHPTSSLRSCGFKGNPRSKREILDFLNKTWGVNVLKATKHVIDAILSAIAGISYVKGSALIIEGSECSIVLACRLS